VSPGGGDDSEPRDLAGAMVMAAGRGERMRPLSDRCPKPLLEVHGKPLLHYPLEALARGGIERVVVNTAWLGEQIEARFGAPGTADPGAPAGRLPKIVFSREGRDFGGALETAGGIARALPLLDEVFWLAAGDVYMPEFTFPPEAMARFRTGGKLAHLFLVPNPAHNPRGDFGLGPSGLALSEAEKRYTYSTVGLYRHALFDSLPAGNPQGLKAPLAPLLRAAMDNGAVTAEIHAGPWTDVGTPERLAQLNAP
jgi:N-acetyl-alpha-D-muramate 1-phosphate uridylyltransferase